MQLYYYISLPYAVAAIKIILCIIIAEVCACYYVYRRRHHHRRQYYCAFMDHTYPITHTHIYIYKFDYNLPKIIFVLETIQLYIKCATLNCYFFTIMRVKPEKKSDISYLLFSTCALCI